MDKNLARNIPSLYIPSLEFIKKAQLPSFELPIYSGSEFNFGCELEFQVSYLEGELHTFYDNKKLIVEEEVVNKGFIFVPVTNIAFNGRYTNETVACYFLVQVDSETEEHFEKAVERFRDIFTAIKKLVVTRKLQNQMLNQELDDKNNE